MVRVLTVFPLYISAEMYDPATIYDPNAWYMPRYDPKSARLSSPQHDAH